MTVDWNSLRSAAQEAQQQAYAPYSHYRVGAACLTEEGQVFTGCNSENASYGVGLCAECGMISALTLGGGGKLRAFVCYGNHEDATAVLTVPCGRCRQLLCEHAGTDFEVELPDIGVVPFARLLPHSFGPEYLEAPGFFDTKA